MGGRPVKEISVREKFLAKAIILGGLMSGICIKTNSINKKVKNKIIGSTSVKENVKMKPKKKVKAKLWEGDLSEGYL